MNSLQTAREAKALSQRELAEAAHVSKRSITAYETRTRRPSPDVARRIGEVLELTTEELWEMFYAGADKRKGVIAS